MADTAPTSPTLTWDNGGTNQAMAAITGTVVNASGGWIQWFGLVNPVSGNKTLRAAFTGSLLGVSLGAISFTGVDQTGGATTFLHGNTNSGTGTALTITITTSTNNAEVAGFNCNSNPTFSAPNQTQAWNDAGSGSITSSAEYKVPSGGASVVNNFTSSKSKAWAASGLDILAATSLPPGESLTDLPPGQQLVRGFGRDATLNTWIESPQIPPSQVRPRGAYYALPPPLPPRNMALQTWVEGPQITPPPTPPPGEQVLDLPPQTAPPRLDETWVEFYNLNLIGQDVLPTGDQSTALPPLGIFWDRSWALNLQETTLAVQAPVGEQIFDLPPRRPPRLDETWTWSFFIPDLPLPPGDKLFDLAPRQYPRPDFTWIQSLYVPALPVPPGDQLLDLPPRGYPRPDETWSYSYNLNLIGQDALPPGDQTAALPPPPLVFYRSWELNLQLTTLAPPVFPKGKQYFDLTPPLPPPLVPTWAWWYNQNLIGQDRLPPGEQSTATPALLTWYRSLELNLLQGTLAPQTLPPGETLFELPPRASPRPDATWTLSFNLSLIGFPVGEQLYDLPPRAPPRPDATWAWSYNLNLIGQDALPAGKQVTERPPPVQWYRSWELDLVLTTLSPNLPPGEQSTALWPPGPPPLVPSWSLNLTRLTTGQMPAGARSYDLAPRGPAPLVPTWTFSYLLVLIGMDRLPPGQQVTNLPPQLPGIPALTFIGSLPLPFVAPVVSTEIHYKQTQMSFGVMGAMVHY